MNRSLSPATIERVAAAHAGVLAVVAALEAERDRLLRQIAEANEKIDRLKARRGTRTPKARKRG
jgi:hypothetical protein